MKGQGRPPVLATESQPHRHDATAGSYCNCDSVSTEQENTYSWQSTGVFLTAYLRPDRSIARLSGNEHTAKCRPSLRRRRRIWPDFTGSSDALLAAKRPDAGIASDRLDVWAARFQRSSAKMTSIIPLRLGEPIGEGPPHAEHALDPTLPAVRTGVASPQIPPIRPGGRHARTPGRLP